MYVRESFPEREAFIPIIPGAYMPIGDALGVSS